MTFCFRVMLCNVYCLAEKWTKRSFFLEIAGKLWNSHSSLKTSFVSLNSTSTEVSLSYKWIPLWLHFLRFFAIHSVFKTILFICLSYVEYMKKR